MVVVVAQCRLTILNRNNLQHLLTIRSVTPSSREQVRGSVFGDRLAAPTMSLEEYGDRQLEEAKAREVREKEHEHAVVKR